MITNTKLYKNNKEEIAFVLILGLVWGLTSGLLGGLLGGLVWGLIYGLIYGLIGGLIYGLIGGLAYGLIGGLVWGLLVILANFNEALPFLMNFKSIIFLILAIIFITELIFWFSKEGKVNKKGRFLHTCKRKFECLFETLLGLSFISQIYILIREIKLKQYLPVILKLIGYIGVGLIILDFIIGLFYLWIKLNELKYRK